MARVLPCCVSLCRSTAHRIVKNNFVPSRSGEWVQILNWGEAMKTCKASGGNRQAASGYAVFCEMHKRRVRRHGDARQVAVTVHELRPYRDRVRRRMKGNSAIE